MEKSLLMVADRLGVVNHAVGVAGRNIAGAFLVFMTVIVMAQVIFRYGLNNSLAWTEELSKTLMVWTAFLVAPWAYREKANVAIELFSDALHPRIRAAGQIIITLLIIWIVSIFLRESVDFVMRGMQSRSASLPISTGYFYLIVPVSFAALLIAAIEQFLRDVVALRAKPE
ncbi:MAG: TRAP transporter small permease [Pseudomonadota bacterium]